MATAIAQRFKGEFLRALIDCLQEFGAERYNKASWKKVDLVAQALVDKAMEGDVPAIREIADRIDGKLPTPIPLDEDGNDGRPMLLVVRWGSKKGEVIANDDNAIPMLELKANGTSNAAVSEGQ